MWGGLKSKFPVGLTRVGECPSVYPSSMIMAVSFIVIKPGCESLCVLDLAYLERKRGQEEGTRSRG